MPAEFQQEHKLYRVNQYAGQALKARSQALFKAACENNAAPFGEQGSLQDTEERFSGNANEEDDLPGEPEEEEEARRRKEDGVKSIAYFLIV